MKNDPPIALLKDADAQQWLEFSSPIHIYTCYQLAEILPTMRALELAGKDGFWVAGWVSYEAAAAFDPALKTNDPGALPLAWFGVFNEPKQVSKDAVLTHLTLHETDWRENITLDEYKSKLGDIKQHLANGDTYQVNYTLRHRCVLSDAVRGLHASADAPYGAYINTGEYCLSSASPELFFKKQGSEITCRPMKGTLGRGLSSDHDTRNRDELASSKKNQAENLMIVDMIRNDLGKVATPGTVKTSELFRIEQYPTVWQMTSTINAETNASLTELFCALFPCASITGAPKNKTMEIIRDLEDSPRQIYTGSIGFVRPDSSMQFNVAIRTLVADLKTGEAEFGVGGGIVWESEEDLEYEECQTKALVLKQPSQTAHELVETLLWTPESGFEFELQHFSRLAQSARYFGYPFNEDNIKSVLLSSVAGSQQPQRVRLTLNALGHASVETTRYHPMQPGDAYRVVVAKEPIDPSNPFYYHKTTERNCYRNYQQAHSDYDDVLLQNPSGEFTESLIANLVIETDGRLFTPPVACGLLPGTARQAWLESHKLEERVIKRPDLESADQIFLLNSVRGLWPIELSYA